jgi:exodeoxyribonuclease VIII
MIKRETFDEYLADPAINASLLKKLRTSPLTAFGIEEETRSKALTLGSIYHTYLLEPDLFDDNYYIYDETPIIVQLIDEGSKSPRATKKYKEWKGKQSDKANGRELVEKGQWLQIEQMAARLKENNPNAEILVRNSDHELSIYQTIEFNGKSYECKCRVDGMNAERGFIFDLKTTQDAHPEGFNRESGKFLYHIQTAFYKRLVELELGKHIQVFIIAQETAAPFNNGLYKVSPEMINKGDYEIENLLKIASHVKETGQLKSYEIFSSDPYGILPLDIPNYYVNSYDLSI